MISGEILKIIIYFVCLLPFLLLSAFFSGTETAFFSLNSLERENLKLATHSRWKKYLQRILAHPDSLLVTILTGNLLVNVFATDFFASNIMDKLAAQLHLPQTRLFSVLSFADLFSIITMTLLILLFGEMTPKNIAVRHPVAFARFAILPLVLSEKIFKPFTFVLKKIQAFLMQRLSGHIQANEDIKSELLSLTVQIGYKEKMLNKFELELFESYIEFRNKTACDVMIPRTKLKGIDISTSIATVLEQLNAPGGREIVYFYVYRKDIDHIAGYIDVKDLLPYRYGLKPLNGLAPLVRPFYSIPESKSLADLSAEMSCDNLAVAHVVDEYGGTAGIITFQQLIEDIFDHFYSSPEDILVKAEGWYQVPGTLELEKIEELLGVEFASETRTISGMIIEYMEEIPESGAYLVIDGVEFIISRVTKNRILTLEFRKQNR